MKSLEIRLH